MTSLFKTRNRFFKIAFFLLVFSFIIKGSLYASVVIDEKVSKGAFIIGNSEYKTGKLRYSVSDAEKFAKSLEELGFEITKLINGDKKAIEMQLSKFISKAQKYEEIIIYYSGHGIAINNTGYIIPIGAGIDDIADVKHNCINISMLAGSCKNDKQTKIFVFDMALNNPFSRGIELKMHAQGMFGSNHSYNDLIVFSALPGGCAMDKNSFTESLIKYIGKKGWTIEKILKDSFNDVIVKTKGKQIPYFKSTLIKDFYPAGK